MRGRGGGYVEVFRPPSPTGPERCANRSRHRSGPVAAALRDPADQHGPARGRTRARPLPPAPGRCRRVRRGRWRVPPGVWPCARTCALAGPRGRRLHGCCVDRLAELEAGSWGNRRLIPRRRWTRSGGRGPPPGPCVQGGAGASRGGGRPWGTPGRAGRGSAQPNGGIRGRRGRLIAGSAVPSSYENGWISTVGRGRAGARADRPATAPPGRGPWPEADVRTRRRRGTQRPPAAPGLASPATRGGRARTARPAVRPAAFARGACAYDVRRP